MRITVATVLTTVMVLLLSCSKSKDGDNTAPEEQTYSASYPNSTFVVSRGIDFTSGPLEHNFPQGVRFSMVDVRNDADKTVSAFLANYQVGTWTQPVNKTTDLTEASVIAKYKHEQQPGVTIDPSTGAITIRGKATQNIPIGIYHVYIEARYNNGSTILKNIARIELGDEAAKQARASWKYSADSKYAEAAVTVTKLTGSGLAEAAAAIDGYNASRTYVRLKIADDRNKGLAITDINWNAQFSPASVNPWREGILSSDAAILASPIDRFPVIEKDSILKGSVESALLTNKKAVDLELALNINGEGIFDVVVKLVNHETQNALWWPKGKEIYSPNELRSNNFNSPDSRWSYSRMDWSDNFVVFWEKGFGSNPKNAPKSVDIQLMLQNLEKAYSYYYDTMHFVQVGNSKADRYRTLVMLYEQDEWLATGSGYDRQAGAMWINYSAAASAATLAHEAAHTFQYLNNCDGKYAYTGNYNYIGQIWEQSAQYQASLLYPTAYQGYIASFVANTHLSLLHEENRYSNFYHLQYWHLLHGVKFVGQLWQQAVTAEDAIDTYKRITGISQSQFNDEIYDYARRTLNWNFLHKSYYTNYILSSSAANSHNSKVNLQDDGYYLIDPQKCVQGYGFNALQLEVPAAGTVVKIDFEGVRGDSRFNRAYDAYAGWRWGLVAVTSTGDAVYSPMMSDDSGELSFEVPASTSRLYFLVVGAPTQHFHHVWDDNPTNDEQYPWKAKFENTVPKS